MNHNFKLTSKACQLVFKALISKIGVLVVVICSIYPLKASIKRAEPSVKLEIMARAKTLASGSSMKVSASKRGIEKSIARTTIMSRLVVKSDNFYPTFDSLGRGTPLA
jgi:hypothetical protein